MTDISSGHSLAFLLNLIYKSCHMALHEFQLFVLFGVDFLQSTDAIHKNSLIGRKLCASPVVLLSLGQNLHIVPTGGFE